MLKLWQKRFNSVVPDGWDVGEMPADLESEDSSDNDDCRLVVNFGSNREMQICLTKRKLVLTRGQKSPAREH
jgi:hypothetical protein